jgi:hypothetical protein
MNRNKTHYAAAASEIMRPFYLEDHFYEMAETLRAQFETKVSPRKATGLTSLVYAYCHNAYQLLTASADDIFEAKTLAQLMDAIQGWANKTLGVSHISTPQLRVYIQGCSRRLLRDDIGVQWHYLFSLTRNLSGKHRGQIKLLGDSNAAKRHGDVHIDQIVRSPLEFNQLLVHQAANSYSIEPGSSSMNPVDGMVLLDGYLW